MSQTRPRYRGVFPVVPTIFDEGGELDLEGQKRCVDFMIDAGSDGLCILANFSEQFVLSDDERELLTRADPRACRRARAGDRHDHAFQHPRLRRAQPPRAGRWAPRW